MTIHTRLLKIIKIVLFVAILVTVGFTVLLYYSTSVTKNIDVYQYQLPFAKGEEHRIVQGYGGLFSHNTIAALDFDMPVGTPIHAARGGVVHSYKDNSDEGGLLPFNNSKANYIIIEHDDGSYGCYWHLKKNGVVVKKGRVAVGQLIGYSGATGQLYKPHLHFSVKRKFSYKKDAYVRTRFKTTKGVVLLKTWQGYERPE